MRVQYPVPVARENISHVWRCVDHTRIRCKQRRASCAAASIMGGICLLGLTFLVGCGMIYEMNIVPFSGFWAWLPGFLPIWRFLQPLLPQPGSSLLTYAVFDVLVVFLVSLFAALVFGGLVRLIYHPFARKFPESSEKEVASGLLANAREAMEISVRIRTVGWIFLLYVFFLVEFAFLTLCVLWLGEPGEVFSTYLTNSTLLNYLILFLAGTAGFGSLHSLLLLIIRSVYRISIAYSFVAEIECYSIYASEKQGKLTYEELLAKRKVRAAEKCKEALALEKSGAYPKAAAAFLEAAHGGDVSAMEHYARHCLISDSRVPAEYWLRRCVATGQASKNAKAYASVAAFRRQNRRKIYPGIGKSRSKRDGVIFYEATFPIPGNSGKLWYLLGICRRPAA